MLVDRHQREFLYFSISLTVFASLETAQMCFAVTLILITVWKAHAGSSSKSLQNVFTGGFTINTCSRNVTNSFHLVSDALSVQCVRGMGDVTPIAQ